MLIEEKFAYPRTFSLANRLFQKKKYATINLLFLNFKTCISKYFVFLKPLHVTSQVEQVIWNYSTACFRYNDLSQ